MRFRHTAKEMLTYNNENIYIKGISSLTCFHWGGGGILDKYGFQMNWGGGG